MNNPPERIKNWRQSQLSIARFYGAVNYNGHRYEICPVTDDLVRADVLAKEKGEKRFEAAERRKWNELQQEGLPF